MTPRRLRILLAFSAVLACAQPRPVTVPPPVPPPPPPPAPLPPPTPPPPPPAAPQPPSAVLIRVGLATDLETLELPCCDGRQALLDELGNSWPLDMATRVSPAESLVRRGIFRLQVAALKDEGQARGIADYLSRETGQVADATFDADTDLYKVRFGRFAALEEAEEARELLAGLGLVQSWVASEGGALEKPGFVIRRAGRGGGEEARAAGRWLEVRSPEGLGLDVHGGRYRGRILLFLNDRGRMNLVNELDLEEYLRGVVPKEMGPELYNQIEALKAQTVAARTYAVRNLGEFSSEGYDICSTPRCQVYGGMAVEHRVSDLAIAKTAGQVLLFEGDPAETFYGATCGGHTENVETIFPLKRGEYLKGVPCVEGGVHRLASIGEAAAGGFPDALTELLLPPPPRGESALPPARVLAARFEHLALLAGLSVPRDELGSLQPDEVRRFLASVFDLALDPRLLSDDPAAFVADPPVSWRQRDRDFGGWLAASGVLGDHEKRLEPTDIEELLYRLALYLGVLRLETAHFLADGEEGRLDVRTVLGRGEIPVSRRLLTFRRQGDDLALAPLELMAGDRLEVHWHRDRVIALTQPVEARPVILRRSHAPRQSWSRYVSLEDLRKAVQVRYPGFPFEGFEVLARGVSGRVGRLRLLGADGVEELVEGLAVRWTFDVPDTWFDAEARTNGERTVGWHFRGRGWGHGVGMCQAGAYGMALRHLGYKEILQHYYSGVRFGVVRQMRPRPRPVVAP